ncbi:N-acetylmuramoyl-L-alanine amidase [Nocardia australiensis]|uniref:N-acetylmuramoyl-L-alanine amidase n=1 Tax=Nocardia australiensis TaxID=2887191 RepID=UPI001D1394D5|nr:N-acetylmuramoyl-L-alanine amidase [Nocardia australiensis]
MKPSIIRAGLCSAVTAAAVVTVSGLVPAAAVPDPASPEMATKLAGRTVFLDPGHQGANHSENLSRQVNDGRGGTKDCQTTGMTSLNGVPEHTINWNVAQLVKTSLESLGAKVVLSRADDSGWGGCVDERAEAANRSGADVAVSIHADSAPEQFRGFHMIVPQLPVLDNKVDQVQSGRGLVATKSVRDAYTKEGFPSANYAGVQDGLQTRADIAGPALTAVPDVFIEMGNGANAEDAAQLESSDGQLKHAITITTGLVGYLLGASSPVGQSGSASDRPAAALRNDPQVPAEPQMTAAPLTVPQAQPSPQPTVPQVQPLPQPTAPQVQPLPQPTAPQVQPLPQPTAPQAQPAPTPNTSQAVPGTSSSPRSQALPQSQTSPRSPGQTAPSTEGSSSGVVGTVMAMLLPLAKSLGVDNTMITSEMINLAYTLASTLLGPAK